jgi:L-ribulose-5-phosphate 3-epimerase
MHFRIDRRRFLASAAGAALPALGSLKPALAEPGRVSRPHVPKLRLAVKYSMIRPGPEATVREKFELVKKIGFAGLEIQAPGEVDVDEAIAASKATGIKIHGVIDAVHWKVRLSDPSAEVRAQAVATLREAIVTAGRVGADTVLLVPGKVNDPKHENWDQVWERSQAGVRACLKDAEAARVVIAIETVGNDFITKPEHLVRYVDEFESPHVGAYFDCSNMLRYGVSSADWIRRLGKRMVKFDFKGYSVAQGAQTKIGEGDENWPEVLRALAEIGYDGWATSEVSGGDEAELTDIYRRMAKALGKG